MIRLDAATVLLQWATGGLVFLWVTTHRREVGIGYGWLLRAVYGAMAVGAVAAGGLLRPDTGRDVCAAVTAAAAFAALVVSVVRRRAGVAGERERAARTALRTGQPVLLERVDTEFPPVLDLAAPIIGSIGLVVAGVHSGGPEALAVIRTLVGAAFLGAVSDAMLLGHWYLVQPGLGRAPLLELVRWTAWVWPFEVAVMLWPPGMVRVLTGRIDDGWGGALGRCWAACAAGTLVLAPGGSAAAQAPADSPVVTAAGH